MQYLTTTHAEPYILHYFNTTGAKLKVTLILNGSSKFCIYYAHIIIVLNKDVTL